MPHAHVNGINLYYETYGKGEPLFLLQGFTKNLLTLMPMIDMLKNDFQVIALDHRGSGRSDAPTPPYTVEQMASDISALMDSLSIKRAHFFGHSMGGAIVQQLAVDHPDKINKIILCSSFAKVPFTALMQMDIVQQMLFAEVPIEFIMQSVLPWQFSCSCLETKGMPEKIITAMMSDPYPQKNEGFLGQGHALKTFNVIDKLEKITAPCLIIVGEEDLYTPPSSSKLMQEKIKMAQMKESPHQGHMISDELPDLLSQQIKAFVLS